jgi:nicotinamidase-related amidase
MKKILIVIDCQKDFIDGSLSNEEAQKKVPNIVKKIEEFDGDAIIYTLDTHEENYLETKEGEKLPVAHCIRNTEGWMLNDAIADAIDKKVKEGTTVDVVEKPTFGSFELPIEVRALVGNDEFEAEFVGFCTDICVVSNALILKAAAFETGNIYVDGTYCAGVTPESHHAALLTMQMCQINVSNIDK